MTLIHTISVANGQAERQLSLTIHEQGMLGEHGVGA